MFFALGNHCRIQRGGVVTLQPPSPLNFTIEIVVIRVAIIVIDLVVTSSNNTCLCALNGVAI